MRKTLYAGLMLSSLILATQANAASMVTADHKGGYSAYVMGEVLPFWTAPQGKTKGPTHVLLEIGGQGELEACRVMTSSGSSDADEAACASAENAAPFLAPPHNFPIDVYMSFWTGKAVATAKKVDKKKVAQEQVKKSELAKELAAKAQADARAEQERIIEEAQKPVETAAANALNGAQKENTDVAKKTSTPEKASTTEKASATEQPSRTYAGIDYSRPRSTPAGLAPLGDLVGAKLPEPKGEEVVAPIPQESPKEEPSKSAEPATATTEQGTSKDFVIILEPAPAEGENPAEGEPERGPEEKHEELSAKPASYPVGKEPFIQENRKGQVMDEDDFYVEQVIRKIRPLVKYPSQMKPGIVSAAVNMYINGAGKVQKVELSSSSNNDALDAALVKASQKITQLPPHPSGTAQELYLIFMVETPKP